MYPKNRDTIGEKDVVGRSGRLGGAVGGCAGPLLGGAYGRSELEVDEGYDVCTLELHDDDHGGGEVECLREGGRLGDEAADGVVDAAGHEV